MPRGQPRYSVVAQSLIDDIASGKHAVGTLLPSEVEICRSFGVSRQTARNAVRMLTEMGLVSPHPGIGTTIRARSATSRYAHTVESISDLFQYIHETELRVIGEREVSIDRGLGELLRGHVGHRWLELETIRSLRKDRTPIVYSRLYMPVEYAAAKKKLNGLRTPAYVQIEKQFGVRVAEMTQEASAQPIPASIAKHLGVKADSAGMHVVRLYLDSGARTLLASASLYPAGRLSLATRMRMTWEK